MKFTLLITFLALVNPAFSFVDLDTISIRGGLSFSNTTITGDFLYTIKNNDTTPHKEWLFLIHPSVNILSVSQNNAQVPIDIQHGLNYRILTVTFNQQIMPDERSTILIRFSINKQNTDPRMTISSNYVFLDARQFWFPYPAKDNNVSFEFTVKASTNLTSIMGGKLTTDTIIIDQRLSTWKNELAALSPSATLIIIDTQKQQQESINIYSSNTNLLATIHQKFSPFWNKMKKDHKYFPLSEIHIVPLDIVIPDHPNQGIDGEFLGNIFLLNNSVIDLVQTATNKNHPWADPTEQIVEILIHELYHSFFPGIAKHDQKDRLFMESLVQYLSWDLINSLDKDWGQRVRLKARFFLQNFFLRKQFNYLWEFLVNSTLLFGISSNSDLTGITLSDTLVEKYQFIEYTKKDVFETIEQHQMINIKAQILTQETNTNQIITNLPYDIFLELPNFATYQKLFNSAVHREKTNFNITVTNKTFFRRKKIVQIPVNASFLSITHNYPFTWFGKLLWVEDKNTNIIDIQIPSKTIWETNIVGEIPFIQTISPLDMIENRLYDNIITDNDIGKQIVYDLNFSETQEHISLSSNAQEILLSWKEENIKIKWDSSVYIDDDQFTITAFLINEEQKFSFIVIPIIIINDIYMIDNIILS